MTPLSARLARDGYAIDPARPRWTGGDWPTEWQTSYQHYNSGVSRVVGEPLSSPADLARTARNHAARRQRQAARAERDRLRTDRRQRFGVEA